MIRACCRFALRLGAAGALLMIALTTLCQPAWSRTDADTPLAAVALAALPREARETLLLIRRGGPFPYERDGVVFGNFERSLPHRERGYYREYTVPTPGLKQRGARRIVAGRGGELYYSGDHYRTFRPIRE